MKQVLLIGSIFFFLISIYSCSPKVLQSGSASEEVYVKEEFTPRGPYFWVEPEGMYKGAIPCNNCAGIEVTLVFNKDYSLEKNMRYIMKGGKTVQSKGTWVVTEGNIIKVEYGGKNEVEYYKAQSGAHLIALNDKKEKIENPSGQFGVFININ